MPIFDIFLLEAVLNGLLFGGVLALLALGLNLIFGVIDVVWICFAGAAAALLAKWRRPPRVHRALSCDCCYE